MFLLDLVLKLILNRLEANATKAIEGCKTWRCLQGCDGWTQNQKTCLQMFPLTRCQSWWICLCASLHYGQTSTNQIAPLIVSVMGGLIIIRPAWWEVNIYQLSRRWQDNKEEPAAAVGLLLMVCLEQKMQPQSVFNKSGILAGILCSLLSSVQTASSSSVCGAAALTEICPLWQDSLRLTNAS